MPMPRGLPAGTTIPCCSQPQVHEHGFAAGEDARSIRGVVTAGVPEARGAPIARSGCWPRRAFGLGFVPVTREPYDLAMAAETLEDALLAPLWELPASPVFLARVGALGGYSTGESGRRRAMRSTITWES